MLQHYCNLKLNPIFSILILMRLLNVDEGNLLVQFYTYLVPEFSKVEIGIYNLQGKLVSVLVNEYSSSGEYDIMWNAGSNPSGIYFITSNIGNIVNIKRVTLLK